ncbi:MAG: hypothetical protein MJ110_02115 [Lachnospiraceae bacterium]|nr:hypothetical protein [Lachnospiraceae bacterium]
MKKKMANDKVIRAMAIGISAVLATAQPMTAFAAEPDSGDAGNNGVESEAKVSVEDVKSAVGNDKTVDDAVTQAGVVEEAAEEAKVAETEATELKENVAAADADMDKAFKNVEAVDKAEDKLIEGKEEADNVVKSITENAAEAHATVEEASKNVDTYDVEIKNATSIAEANTAYENIIVEVSNAEEACEEAKKKHAELMSDYDKALDEIKIAKKAYEDAKEEGLGNIDEALANLASAKLDAEAIRDKAIVVEAEIDILKDIEIQKTKVDKIANKEETGNYWREADKLANLMIKYSYIIRDDVDVNSISFSTWVSDKSDDNNVVVTYKLKGSDKEVTDYFDYVAYDSDGNDIVSTNKTPASITVLKKIPAYESEEGNKLTVSSEDDKLVYKINGENLAENQSIVVEEDGNIKVVTSEITGYTTEYKNGESSFEVVVKNGNGHGNGQIQYKVDGKPLNGNANVKYTVEGDEKTGYTVTTSEKKKVDFHNEFSGDNLVVILDQDGNLKSIDKTDSIFPVTYRNFKKVSDTVYEVQVWGLSTCSWRTHKLYATNNTIKVDGWVETDVKTYGKVETPTYKTTEETFASGTFVNKGDSYLSDNDVVLVNKIKNVDLLNAANEQIKRVEAAEKAVENIKAQMAALDVEDFAFDEGGYASLLISYQTRLYAAEANLEAAKEKLVDIKNKEAVAKADLAATIARLTPAPVRRNDNNRVPVVQEATPALDFVYAPGVAVAAAPMQVVAGGQPAQIAQDGGNAAAQGAGEVFDLGEAATPLADFAEEDETLNEITLQDEATPLVDFEQASRMSWWWLLVVAVLGVTGYELYEKHQKKIEAREEAAKKTK